MSVAEQWGHTCGKACSDTELRLLLEAVLLVVVMSPPQSNSDTERAVSGSSLLCLLGRGGPMRACETLRCVRLPPDGPSRGSFVGLEPMVKGCVTGRTTACTMQKL